MLCTVSTQKEIIRGLPKSRWYYPLKKKKSVPLSVIINCLIIPFGSDLWLWLGLGLDQVLVFEKTGTDFQISNYS